MPGPTSTTMAPIPTTEPASINAGDTIRWQRSLPDYPPAEGWQLSYTLVNASARLVIASTASGDAHLVNVPASTSAGWAAGAYNWRAQVSKTGDVFTVGQGAITISPSFAAAVDGRSSARQALDSVEAYLKDPSNITAAEYQIAGRQLRRHSLQDLWRHRDRLRIEVKREEMASGGSPSGKILVRFR